MKKPLTLFVSAVVLIFAAEAVVMLVLPELDCQTDSCRAIVDASLLSVLVVPVLYFLFFKPLQKTIISLERSEKYKQEMEKIDKIKSDFISVAAHELCTPVSAIMGYAELLQDDPEEDQRQQFLQVISDKADALERIIDDLLVLNRYETSTSLDIKLEENDLVAVLRSVVEHYRRYYPDKPIQLHLTAGSLVFHFDLIRINQVLDNIISNAVKYSNDVHDPIDLKVEEQDSNVIIEIRDEGIGMTPGELKQVYKKFFRAETEKSAVGGLGLGMAIVKNIVESHQGTIDIVSQRGVGTTVTVSLPKDP